MTLKDNLTRQLTGDEGYRPKIYRDSLGYFTIGIGRLVDPGKIGGGLRPTEIAFMLSNDIDDRLKTLELSIPFWNSLSEPRKAVLLNMSFQLGVNGLMQFTNTLRMIKEDDFDGAATGMLQSKWASQTPARAKRLSEQMRTNTWQYTPGT